MKRILIIATHFYPEIVPRAIHLEGLVSGLCRQGYTVDLVLPDRGFRKSKELSNLTLHFVRNTVATTRKELIRNIPHFFSGTLPIASFDRLAFNHILKHDLDKKTDIVLTISWPFMSHIVGFKLKKRNPHLTWIAEYSDPITPKAFASLYPASPPKNKLRETISLLPSLRLGFSEKRIFKKIDHVLLPIPAMMKYFLDTGMKQEQLHVISQLFADVATPAPHGYTHLYPDKINLLLFGMLHPQIRNPLVFLKAYKRATDDGKNLALHYFGEEQQMLAYLQTADLNAKTHNIYVNERLERNKLLDLICHVDILLHLNNAGTNPRPSKVLDLIKSDKPILNMGPPLFENTFSNVDNEEEAIYQRLMSLSKHNPPVDYTAIKALFSYESNLAKYTNVLNSNL